MKFGTAFPISDVAVWLENASWQLQQWVVPIVAQAAQEAGEGADGALEPTTTTTTTTPTGSVLEFLANPLNLILISAILFMFIVARPQQKQRKEQEEALSGLKKNDRVVTNSGIHGIVVQTNSEEGTVTIRIDENSGARMTVNRDTIANITPSDSKE